MKLKRTETFVDDLYDEDEEPEQEIVILCCEYPKNGSERYGEPLPEPAIYEVIHDPSPSEIFGLELRERYNPELQYYYVRKDKSIEGNDLIEYAKTQGLKPPFFIRLSKT
jgi:hypothetical protein